MPLLKRSLTQYIAVKVLVDQFVFEPPNLLVFFTASTLLAGEGRKEIVAKLKAEYWETFVMDCKVRRVCSRASTSCSRVLRCGLQLKLLTLSGCRCLIKRCM